MRWDITGLLLLSLMCAASAEVRVINATGKDLTLDVLSKGGRVENVKIRAQASGTFAVGPQEPPGAPEMLVVKENGAEAYRAEVNAGQIVLLKNWNPYLYDYVGTYKPNKPNNSYPRIVNALQQAVDYEVEEADMSLSKGALTAPDQNAVVHYDDVGRARNAGEVVPVSLKPSDGGPGIQAKLKAGVVYFLSRGSDGTLKLEAIGSN